MTPIGSKPPPSATRAIAARSCAMRFGPPGQVKALICKPSFNGRPLQALSSLAHLHAICEVLADLLDLRTGVEKDVRLQRVAIRVVLVIFLGLVEPVQR